VARTDKLDSTIKKVMEGFAGAVSVDTSGKEKSISVSRERLHELLSFLKSDGDAGFTMLTDLFAVDHYGKDPRFEVVYLLTSWDSGNRVVVKTGVGDHQSVPTATDLWQGADWFEREAYDMFGVRFEGHPDPRRILTVEDFDGYPLRKDFPTEGYDFDKPFKVVLQEEME
jgi:NADH-quinone oxidoreductase subunit C